MNIPVKMGANLKKKYGLSKVVPKGNYSPNIHHNVSYLHSCISFIGESLNIFTCFDSDNHVLINFLDVLFVLSFDLHIQNVILESLLICLIISYNYIYLITMPRRNQILPLHISFRNHFFL